VTWRTAISCGKAFQVSRFETVVMATDGQDDVKVITDRLVISDYVHPHAVNAGVPVEEIKPPILGREFEVDEAVLDGKSCIPP